MGALSDADLLCALAQNDLEALRELHRRYAPLLYAMAERSKLPDPDTRVQDAWLLIMRQAHCHASTSLEARLWLIGMARQVLMPPDQYRATAPLISA
ncbi:hypothetical protein ACFSC4_02310 [Deinococcus malanensis]